VTVNRNLRLLFLTMTTLCLAVSAVPQPVDQPPLSSDESDRVSEQRLDQALASYQADDRLQRTRPGLQPAPDPVLPPDRRPSPLLNAIASFFSAIANILGYLLLALIAAAILYGIYLTFGSRFMLRGGAKQKRAVDDISVQPDLQPEASEATALLAGADALAAQGRFAEAVHLLLFRSIDDIRDKTGGAIRPSLTAREIGALSILPDTIREALAPIIRIVEQSFFGGHDVTETHWKNARASYQAFAFGAGWA
jgi:Domain of unknown function (DUF4129)